MAPTYTFCGREWKWELTIENNLVTCKSSACQAYFVNGVKNNERTVRHSNINCGAVNLNEHPRQTISLKVCYSMPLELIFLELYFKLLQMKIATGPVYSFLLQIRYCFALQQLGRISTLIQQQIDNSFDPREVQTLQLFSVWYKSLEFPETHTHSF